MKFLMTAALFAVPFFANAQDTMVSSSSLSEASSYRIVEFYDVEAQIYATSIAPTMTFGPSFAYHMDDINHVGFRVLAPTMRNDDVSALSISGFYRRILSQKRTGFYAEGGASHNIFGRQSTFGSDSALSVEAGAGISHRITNDFGVGGLAGVSVSQADVKRDSLETHTSEIFVYPRLALYGSFEF